MNIMRAIATAFVMVPAMTIGIAVNVNADESGKCGLYEYRADIRRVVDGDTVDVDIDLGFNVWLRNERLRLYGIDTPEVKGSTKAEGLAAKNALIQKVRGKQVTICTVKARKGTKDRKGKFGRYLATIWINGENVNAWLVSNGFAVWRDY